MLCPGWFNYSPLLITWFWEQLINCSLNYNFVFTHHLEKIKNISCIFLFSSNFIITKGNINQLFKFSFIKKVFKNLLFWFSCSARWLKERIVLKSTSVTINTRTGTKPIAAFFILFSSVMSLKDTIPCLNRFIFKNV